MLAVMQLSLHIRLRFLRKDFAALFLRENVCTTGKHQIVRHFLVNDSVGCNHIYAFPNTVQCRHSVTCDVPLGF